MDFTFLVSSPLDGTELEVHRNNRVFKSALKHSTDSPLPVQCYSERITHIYEMAHSEMVTIKGASSVNRASKYMHETNNRQEDWIEVYN